MRVQSTRAARLERRLFDYFETIDKGTNPLVGRRHPELPDVRGKLRLVLRDPLSDQELAEAERLLDDVWKRDAPAWPQRLRKPFLAKLTDGSHKSFRKLVQGGCQPDALAARFTEAARPPANSTEESRHVREQIQQIEVIAPAEVAAVKTYAARRHQLDDYCLTHRLRIPYDGLVNELEYIAQMLEENASNDIDDLRRLSNGLDPRKRLVETHAIARVYRQIHLVTGNYHDSTVEAVLNDLRRSTGQREYASGTLKRRRTRRFQQLRGNN